MEVLWMFSWLFFFFSTFIYGARRARVLSFLHAFLQKLLTWLSNFKFLSIAIARSTSFVFSSMEESSITSVDGSLQPRRRWILSLLAFSKVLKVVLSHLKYFYDDVSNALITGSLSSVTIMSGIIRIACLQC